VFLLPLMNQIDFIHDLTWDDIPVEVRQQAKRCLLDTIGVAIGGFQTETARIMYNHASRVFGGQGGYLWFDGREVSMPGAVLAHGMTIDSLDLHDSCRPVKGHAGISQVPTSLATIGLSPEKISGKELLTTLTMAYDIAIRAGTAQHATCCDYHTSGAWNALGCAAIVARRLRLDHEKTRHALGIAEYHGPRSQMMRAIDYPTMVKDGSGWGAMAGVTAGLMAEDGFTGAPALTIESEEAAEFWTDLRERWSLMIQYFKPYGVCYWAQAAIAGALGLKQEHGFKVEEIAGIKVHAFHEATRLAMRYPKLTDEAQYSLPFPVAGALVHGQLFLEELRGENLHHPEVLRLSSLVELIDDDYFNDRFPEYRLSRVIIETQDGNSYDSGVVHPKWSLEEPATDDELLEKFRYLAHMYLPASHADELESAIRGIESMDDVSELVGLLATKV
jgi:2-methylcitrate dehydratase PrpD